MGFPTIDDNPDFDDEDDNENTEALLISKEDLVKDFREVVTTLEKIVKSANILQISKLVSYDEKEKKIVVDEKALEEISVYELHIEIQNLDDILYLSSLIATDIAMKNNPKQFLNGSGIPGVYKDDDGLISLKEFLNILHKQNKKDGPEV